MTWTNWCADISRDMDSGEVQNCGFPSISWLGLSTAALTFCCDNASHASVISLSHSSCGKEWTEIVWRKFTEDVLCINNPDLLSLVRKINRNRAASTIDGQSSTLDSQSSPNCISYLFNSVPYVQLTVSKIAEFRVANLPQL